MQTCSVCLQGSSRLFFHNGVCENCDPYNADEGTEPTQSWPLGAVIALAYRHWDENGERWVTEAAARDKGAQSSAADLLRWVDAPPVTADWFNLEPPEDAWTWLAGLSRKPEASCSDYENALVLLHRTGRVTRETWGLACSVWHAFLRHQKQAEASGGPVGSGPATGFFLGKLGDRMDIPGCQCFDLRPLGANPEHPEWGERFLIKFTAPGGEELVWFASTGGKFDPKIGETYNVRATIFKHEEYNGRRQTIIQRPAEYDPKTGKLLHPPKRKAEDDR